MPPASEHDTYVPKHRQPPARRASKTAVRTLFVLSSVAVVGTGVAVAGGAVSLSPGTTGDVAATSAADLGTVAVRTDSLTTPTSASTSAPSTAAPSSGSSTAALRKAAVEAAATERRVVPVSRSDRRGTADPLKAAALSTDADGNAMTRSENLSGQDPRTIAQALLSEFGFSSSQFGCLDSLWTKESGWRVNADNPSSSAYGIPQALPGSKMSSYGDDWATNPVTQIRWGLDYINDRYGSPCGAWSHSQSNGWY